MVGVRSVPELRGITPNSFAHIFGQIANASAKSTFLVHVSYLEIYNEDIRDLLVKNRKTKLEIKERPDCGVCVRNLSSVTVHTPGEMERLMNFGSRNRKCLSLSHLFSPHFVLILMVTILLVSLAVVSVS